MTTRHLNRSGTDDASPTGAGPGPPAGTGATGMEGPPVADAATATRRPSWGHWAATALVAVLLAQFAHLLITNDNFAWPVVAQYFLSPPIIDGLQMTLLVAAVSMAIGCLLGVAVAVCRLSSNPLLKAVGGGYVWIFRGTPALVQLLFWFNFAALLPQLSVGIPFGPALVSWPTNSLITAMTAAIVGLGLHETAYMAEIVRGGLLSVDHGQKEAAQSLGMSRARTLVRVVLPQAMRAIVPPTGSRAINMVLATSLVSFVALADLLYTVQSIYNRTFEIIPLLMVAVLWYLVISSVLYVFQSWLERHYGRGSARTDTNLRWQDLAARAGLARFRKGNA